MTMGHGVSTVENNIFISNSYVCGSVIYSSWAFGNTLWLHDGDFPIEDRK
jgi:hypothetical protein